MRVVNVAVEGATDLAVISKVLADAGMTVGRVYGQNGKRHLDSCLAGFNNSAKYRPWVVVRDLDRDADCAATLIAALLPQPARWMRLRIATREIESWLLADADALSKFLSIRSDRIPVYPDQLDDPKGMLVTLASTSPRKALVEDQYLGQQLPSASAAATPYASPSSRLVTGGLGSRVGVATA